MVCSYRKLIRYAAQAAALTIALAGCASALTVLAPTPGQAVRETAKITLPADAVPMAGAPGFISILVEENGAEKFVTALSRDSAKQDGNRLTFYWNTKAPYYDSNAPMKQNYFKDGPHVLKIQVHNSDGKAIDSATVEVNIKNKVARPNPAPAVRLVNRLSFGEINSYDVSSDLQVFQVVAKVGLPILGGLGIQGDYKIVQSVEDVRPDGQLLLRLRLGDTPYISMQGVKTVLYQDQQIKPQLYRLITKYGQVVDRNLFTRQAQYSFMDIVPTLPSNAVKEGDSWPDTMSVKIEGLTPLITLEGTSQLDSFEWQNGHKCAKIISNLTTQEPLSLVGGKIQGNGAVTARVTTYFAYDGGRLIQRDIDLEFPASIAPDLGTMTGSAAAAAPSPMESIANYYQNRMFQTDEDEMGGPPSGPGMRPGTGTKSATDTGIKKGTVRINVKVRLEI